MYICAPSDRTTELQQIRSVDPKPHLGHSGCALQSVEQFDLVDISVELRSWRTHWIYTIRSIVYPCNVVHASRDEECAIRRPSEVVYLRAAARSTHRLHSPMLHIFLAILTKTRGRELGWSPEQDIAIISGGSEKLACITSQETISSNCGSLHTSRTPSNDVYSLCVLFER